MIATRARRCCDRDRNRWSEAPVIVFSAGVFDLPCSVFGSFDPIDPLQKHSGVQRFNCVGRSSATECRRPEVQLRGQELGWFAYMHFFLQHWIILVVHACPSSLYGFSHNSRPKDRFF